MKIKKDSKYIRLYDDDANLCASYSRKKRNMTGITKYFKELKKAVDNDLTEKIRTFLELIIYNNGGWRKMNGGYTDVEIRNVEEKDNYVHITGYSISGTEDCGDGHSEKYTDELDCYFRVMPNMEFTFVEDSVLDKVKEMFE